MDTTVRNHKHNQTTTPIGVRKRNHELRDMRPKSRSNHHLEGRSDHNGLPHVRPEHEMAHTLRNREGLLVRVRHIQPTRQTAQTERETNMTMNASLHPHHVESNDIKAVFWHEDKLATLSFEWNRDEVTMFLRRMSNDEMEIFVSSLETATTQLRDWHEKRLEADDV